MGLFDRIRCYYPLPDLKDSDKIEFQTKSIANCGMDRYTITQEGRLLLHYVEWEATPEEEMPYYGKPEWEHNTLHRIAGSVRIKSGSEKDIDMNYHGYIVFYTSRDGIWIEYKAKFTDGLLVKVERIYGNV